MIHNISRFIAALALLATAQGVWAQDAISGLTYNSTGGYYEISDAQDLASLATYVNGGNDASGKTFKQTKDITLTEAIAPIGYRLHDFNGTYDGGGYSISGLNVSSITEDGLTCSGLFGYVYGANLHDIVLISPTVSTSVANDMNTYVGPIVGYTENSSARVSNCTVINPTVTLPDGFQGSAGAIVGMIFNGNVTDCHFYGGNQNDAYGSNMIGKVTNVSRVYTLTATGCTATATATVTVGTTSYYNSGTAVSLGYSGTPAAGYLFSGYASDDVTITDGAFTMPAADVTVAATFAPDPAHFSVSGDEYTIHTATGWGVFCDLIADGESFSGKTVKLGADITVTRMAGSSGHEFTGTFDGGGKTLTVNYTNNNNDLRTAPFSYVNGATIQNLIVGGTISGTAYRAAGIVGETPGQTTITNCVSSVDISSGRYTGGISIGGLVTITGCVFNGKIVGTSLSGGFVGYSNTATAISNSLFDPQDGSSISGGTFYYNGGGDITPTNSYYTRALGTAQGKATRTVAAADDVTIEAVALTGTATQYTVSGITAYSGGGLQRGQTLYYGSGDQLSLTLSNTAPAASLGYQYAYTASAGTLSGTTLTMPDQDVTISAALAPIDWATVNQGTIGDPYMIYNKDQLLLLAHRVNGTSGETANTYEGMYFKLGADITFDPDVLTLDDGQSNYEAIGGYYDGSTTRFFKGQFDGANHTVSGIRICKDGGYDTDSNQGLFGRIGSGAEIYDVHLTDARITGYQNVGGIVGYNDEGFISGCSVTDSYITATDDYYGTICGFTTDTYRLSNNYYHGCTVNGTAVTSGKGCQGADIADYNGALPAYRLALGANITTPPGTFAGQTEWLDTPPVDARLAPENGFTLAGNHYFASGYEFTPGSTLASGAAQGYTPRATLDGQLLDPYTPTGEADQLAGTAIAQFTVTANCDGKTLASTEAIYSTGQPVTVAYVNADGTAGQASAIALDGTETSLAAGTYFAGLENVNFDHTVNLNGNVTLILKDGCTMNVGTSEAKINGHGIAREDGGDQALTIYGQTTQTGALNVYTDNGNKGIVAKAVTINGGNVTIDANGDWATGISAGNEDITINGGNVSVTAPGTNAWAIYAKNNVTINGGTVEASGTADGIRIDNGTIAINGGTVNASGSYGINANYGTEAITLGWTKPTDRITASSYSGTVQVADGKKLHNGSDFLYGSLDDPATALNGKTLRPAAAATYTTADGTTATADAILLDASDNSLPAGNYLATGTLNYTHGITLNGNVTLILADNCHMNVGTSGERINDYGFFGFNGGSHNITITSQSLGDDMGALSVYTTGMNMYGILANAITIDGGNVTADTNGDYAVALYAGHDIVTINGGNVTANTAGTEAHAIFAIGDFNYNGGNVTATAAAANANAICASGGNYTFSWRTPADRITIGATGLYAPEGKTATFARPFTDGSGNIYTGTLAASVLSGFAAETTLQPCLALADAADNTAAITDHADQTLAVALTGRTLYKDGSWNTLCLPFSVTTASGTLSGDNVQAMTLDTSTSTFADGTLTLNFTAADETIPAGTPFIIKWDQPANYEPYTGQNAATCSDLVSPVFLGVTINAEKHDATVTDVLTFTGTYAPVSITDADGDNTKLYLGAANTLYYPSKAMTIGTHRAYFQLADGLTAGNPVSGSNANQIRAFALNFGDDEATGIISVHDSGFTVNASAAWYTLDGRRLDAVPTAKGLYIHGGKKVAIK